MSSKLRDALAAYPEWSNCHIQLLKEGHNRSVFLLTKSNGEQFIAKQELDKGDPGSSATRERLALSFLHSQNVNFVPQVLLWDEERGISIETHVGEADADFAKLTPNQITLFASQLWTLHSLSLTDRLTNHLAMPPLESLQLYGFDRLRIAQETCPPEAKEILEWIEVRLAHSVQIIQSRQPQTTPHLRWGDVGGNIRVSQDGRLYFIDFEHANVSPGSELAYIAIHSHLPQPLFEQLVNEYAKNSHRTAQDLQNEMQLEEQIVRTNDVIWAAMKWGQAHVAKDPDAAQQYHLLTSTRLKLARGSIDI